MWFNLVLSKAEQRYSPKQGREGVCWVITERELQQLCFQGPSADNASNLIPQGQRLEEEEGATVMPPPSEQMHL